MSVKYCEECLWELQYCEECEKHYCPDCAFCDCEALNIEREDTEDGLPKEVIEYMEVMIRRTISSNDLNDRWEWDEDGNN